MVGGVLLAGLLVPLSTNPRTATVLATVAFAAIGAGSCVTGSSAVTLRHLLTPPALHARMNASYRLFQFVAAPLAALAAGLLVDVVSARTTLWLGAMVMVAAALPLASRPVRTVRVS
jgi:fucose permease